MSKPAFSALRALSVTIGEEETLAVLPRRSTTRVMEKEAKHCRVCGGEIPKERLEVIPDTLVCVRCSRKMGGEFEVKVRVGGTGKAGSLKITGQARRYLSQDNADDSFKLLMRMSHPPNAREQAERAPKEELPTEFLKAVESYVEAVKAKKTEAADEALGRPRRLRPGNGAGPGDL